MPGQAGPSSSSMPGAAASIPGASMPDAAMMDTAAAYPFPALHPRLDMQQPLDIPPATTTGAGASTHGTSFDEITQLEAISQQTFEAFKNSFTFPCSHGHPSESITSFNSVLRGHYIRFDEAAKQQFQGSGDQIYAMIFSRVTELIEKVVKFCKAVPGFRDISLEDQMEVLKGATFEIVAFRAAFFIEDGHLVFFGDPHCILSFDMLAGTPLEKLFRDIERISSRLMSLNISMTEFSLVCGVLVFSAGKYPNPV